MFSTEQGSTAVVPAMAVTLSITVPGIFRCFLRNRGAQLWYPLWLLRLVSRSWQRHKCSMEHLQSKFANIYRKNVPTKMITYKHRLPWVTNSLRKLINRKNKAYSNRKNNPTKYKDLKRAVQKELRSAYWNYIEKIITDIPIDEPDQHKTSKAKHKNLFSYIKSIRTENSGVAPLKSDGILVTDTQEKANILNNQFQSVFTNETNTNIPDKGTSPTLTCLIYPYTPPES